MRNYRDILVWRKAHSLVMSVYKATRAFPDDERYGLVTQIRRAAVSIPSNIAEGCGRESDKEFSHFLSIAQGSTCEVDYQLILARDLHYVSTEAYEPLAMQVQEVGKMLRAFIINLKQRS